MTYLLIAVLCLTALLLVWIVRTNKQASQQPSTSVESQPTSRESMACCGAHEVCEAETLLALADKVVYYADEELDRFRGQDPFAYTETDIEEFRDVLLTLRDYEVAGWMRSLALRRIEPPLPVRRC